MGFTDADERRILHTLAGVLHLGNVKFLPTSDNSDGCVLDPTTSAAADHVCRLLGFDRSQFELTLRFRHLKVGTEVTERPLKAVEVCLGVFVCGCRLVERPRDVLFVDAAFEG